MIASGHFFKIAILCPTFLLGKTIWDKSKGRLPDLFPALPGPLLIFRWTAFCVPTEKSRKRRQAFKPDIETSVRYRYIFFEQQPGMVDPYAGQVSMRCFAVDRFEQPDKMELGKIGFIGNVVKIDALTEIRINEQLRLNNPFIKIYFWIIFVHGRCLIT